MRWIFQYRIIENNMQYNISDYAGIRYSSTAYSCVSRSMDSQPPVTIAFEAICTSRPNHLACHDGPCFNLLSLLQHSHMVRLGIPCNDCGPGSMCVYSIVASFSVVFVHKGNAYINPPVLRPWLGLLDIVRSGLRVKACLYIAFCRLAACA